MKHKLGVSGSIIYINPELYSELRVVHLHNIHYEGERYIWIPVHPTQEHSGNHKVKKVIEFLSELKKLPLYLSILLKQIPIRSL